MARFEGGDEHKTNPQSVVSGRKGSYFPPRRTSTGESDNDLEDPVTRRLRYFCRELSQICQLRSVFGLRSSYQCFVAEEETGSDERMLRNLARMKKHA